MAIEYSPAIVTQDLAFYYDMGNTKKSWIGPPVTNSVTNSNAMLGWSNYYRTTASSTFITEFGTTGYRFLNQPSWNGIQRGITIPTTGTYTFSAWFRYLGGSVNNNGATVYISGWGGGDSAVAVDKSLIGVWQRRSVTLNCTTTSMTFYLISYGGTDNGTGNPDFSSWEVTMPQVEPGSFATPFVNGTRSNTQAILDLAGGNTITASSLTYASDGTFSFGGGDFITIPTAQLGNGNVQWTINAWVKTTTAVNALGLGSVASNSSGGPVYSMMGVNNGKIVYWTYQNSAWAQKLSTGKTVNDNVWHMLTWVNYANNTMDMYVDGVLDFTVANSTSGNNNPIDRIGGSWAGQFVGSIASVSRYTRALTAAEVNNNFTALRGRFGV